MVAGIGALAVLAVGAFTVQAVVRSGTPADPGSEAQGTVDGGAVASETLEDALDVGSHEVVVPDGVSVVVTVAADDPDQDVDVELDGEPYAVNGDEEISLDGPVEATMEVHLFTAGPARYTITVEPA